MNTPTSKFCSNCGTETAKGENFCAGCGMKLAQVNQPQQAPHEKYYKMGGWLLFFIIINIIAVVGSLVPTMNEIYVSAEALEYSYGSTLAGLVINIFAQVVTLAALVFAVLWIIQVFQRKTLFLRFIQIESMLMTASYILSFVAICVIGLDYYDSVVTSRIIGGLVGSIAGFFLMTLYYCKSVRVNTYMGSDEYQRKAIFAYKKPSVF